MPTTRANQGSDAKMTKYYRARITLEEITPLPTPDNHSRENTRIAEIAEITVAASDPGSALSQAMMSAGQLAYAQPRRRRATSEMLGTFRGEKEAPGSDLGAERYAVSADPWDTPTPAKKAPWAEALKPEPATGDREAFIPKEPEKQ